MSYFHAMIRTIFVYKVTVPILGTQRLTCLYIDVIYCITRTIGVVTNVIVEVL